jgi:putative aldouronate transport system permease protein
VGKVSKKDKSGQSLNQIKASTNFVFNLVFLILAVMCVIPLLFVFSISITDEEVLRINGYQMVPQVLSTSAYEFLWNERLTILRAAFMSMLVTVVGTMLSIALNTSMGYVVSRRNFKLKKIYTWMLFIPMVFNGGMLASYVVVNNILKLNNNIWALILPLACSAFSVTICRTFFRTTVPDSIIESAKIDGAGQFRIWSQIVLPISKPVMATIGMFAAFGYWNDWFQASLYIQDTKKQTLQSLLNQMQKNIEYIANNPYGGLSLQEYKLGMPTESVRMAIAIVIIVPIACTYPFFQKYFISGLTVGSVKE